MAKTGLDVLVDEEFAAAVKTDFTITDMSIAQDPWVA